MLKVHEEQPNYNFQNKEIDDEEQFELIEHSLEMCNYLMRPGCPQELDEKETKNSEKLLYHILINEFLQFDSRILHQVEVKHSMEDCLT
jgi:hypothetical protein